MESDKLQQNENEDTKRDLRQNMQSIFSTHCLSTSLPSWIALSIYLVQVILLTPTTKKWCFYDSHSTKVILEPP